MKQIINLIFEPRGKHDPALAYAIKDTVMSADGARVYFALQDVPAGVELTDGDYWKLQIDLSASKAAMDEAVAAFGNSVKAVGQRVRGETAVAGGNPVTFLPDAGSLLQPVTVLEPIQEGSGDPYPAGCGKNLFDSSIVTDRGVYGLVTARQADGSIRLTGTAENATRVANPTSATFLTLQPGTYTLQPDFVSLRYMVNNVAQYHSGTFTLEAETEFVNAVFNVVAGQTYNEYVYIQLEAGSEATDYAPYSNIRTISGWDAVGLNHAGKNLIPRPYYREKLSGAVYESNGITWTVNEDGSIHAKGVATARSEYALCSRLSGARSNLVLPAGSYTLSGWRNIGGYTPSTNGTGYIMITKFDPITENEAAKYNYKEDAPVVWTCESGSDMYIVIRIIAGIEVDTVFYPQLETGSATKYKPYQGNRCAVEIGQSVYGGRLDWLTGVLTADRGFISLDGTEDWSASTTNVSGKSRYGMNASHVPGILIPPDTNTAADGLLCSHYNAVPNTNLGTYACVTGVAVYTSGKIYIYDEVYASSGVDAFKAYLAAQAAAGTPVQIAYRLATPVEIQLTPRIISAVEPEQENTLYGDGSIEVEYVKPLHVSIGERVAAAIAAANK